MTNEPIIATWTVTCKTQNTSFSVAWNFKKNGLIYWRRSMIGNWSRRSDGYYRLQLAVTRELEISSDLTAVVDEQFMVVYGGGREVFTGVCRDLVKRSESVESKTAAVRPSSVQLKDPWVGVWEQLTGSYLERVYRDGRCIAERSRPTAGKLILKADGSYLAGTARGFWQRSPDGRLALDVGTTNERYYFVAQVLGGRQRIGPFKKNGTRYTENTEYTFYETLQQATAAVG